MFDLSAYPRVDFDTVGPKLGERLPDVILPDQHGQTVDLHKARGNRRAILLFNRSAGW